MAEAQLNKTFGPEWEVAPSQIFEVCREYWRSVLVVKAT
jgi:hypothetical protein